MPSGLRLSRVSWSTFGRARFYTSMAADTVQSPKLANESALPPKKKKKLTGRAFYESIGSPKVVVAPMVDQSEFAWRVLTRSFMGPEAKDSLLAYSPMFHARLFSERQVFRDQHFQPTRAQAPADETEPSSEDAPYLDGRKDIDRPLFVQFCANEPEEFLAAAEHVQEHCDAVDLNLGCPQGIARSGKYGAFLQEDQDRIFRLINTLHKGLDIPVTAKIRILDTREATLAYAKNVLSAGASILTVHGRRREQKGHNTGIADWSMIRFLRDNLPPETVLFANGNILRHEDISQCLEETGADAVMSAEGNLSDPTIFAPRPKGSVTDTAYWRSLHTSKGGYRLDHVFRRYMSIIYKYVLERPEPDREPLYDPENPTPAKPLMEDPNATNADGEPPRKRQKKTKKDKAAINSPNLSAMQAHLFRLLRSLLSARTNVRDALARARSGDIPAFEYVLALTEQAVREGLDDYAAHPEKYEDPQDREQAVDAPQTNLANHESSLAAVKACKRPWFVCSSNVRPVPKEAYELGSMQPKTKNKAAKQSAAADSMLHQSAVSKELSEVYEKGLESISEGKADGPSSTHQDEKEAPSPALVCG